MQLSGDGFFDLEPVVGYATSTTWELTGADGLKSVYARFLDAAGNASAVTATTVILDRAAPIPGGLLIDNGSNYNADSAGNVALSLSAMGADEVNVSQDSCGAETT